MKIAMTGASGAIGTAFLERLTERQVELGEVPDLVAITSSPGGEELLRRRFPEVRVMQHRGWSRKSLKDALPNVDVLVHMAWGSVPGTAALDPAKEIRQNVEDVRPLLDMVSESGVPRVVFVSSGGTVYGPMREDPITEMQDTEPTSAYGRSKLLFERMLIEHAANHRYRYLILRPSNVYGMMTPSIRPQGVVQHWMKAVRDGRPVELWNEGTTMRDYIHVDDMVDALVLSLDRSLPSDVLNIGTGVGTTLAQLLDRVEAITSRRIQVVHRSGLVGAVERNVLSPVKASRVLGFQAKVPLNEGLQRTWNMIAEQLPD